MPHFLLSTANESLRKKQVDDLASLIFGKEKPR